MVMANDTVTVRSNLFDDNPTAQVMVISYPNAFTDTRYIPTPRQVLIGLNHFGRGGYDPQVPGAQLLLSAFGGSLPPVLWDGLGDPATTVAMAAGPTAWTLGLTSQGAAPETGRPGIASLPATLPGVTPPDVHAAIGAPAALDARIGK